MMGALKLMMKTHWRILREFWQTFALLFLLIWFVFALPLTVTTVSNILIRLIVLLFCFSFYMLGSVVGAESLHRTLFGDPEDED